MEKQGQLAKNCGHSGKQIGFLRYHQTIAFFTGGFLGYFILRQSNILELGNMFETMANMMLSGIFSVNMNAFGRAPTIVWSPKSDVKICLKTSQKTICTTAEGWRCQRTCRPDLIFSVSSDPVYCYPFGWALANFVAALQPSKRHDSRIASSQGFQEWRLESWMKELSNTHPPFEICRFWE